MDGFVYDHLFYGSFIYNFGMATVLAHYRIVKCLGSGGYGTVVLARDLQGNDSAIKIIDKKKVKASGMEAYIENQINIMKQFNSQYLVQLHSIKEDEKSIYLELEYCDGRDLERLKRAKKNKVFLLDEATFIISEVLKGLQVIHSKGYIHRDIKMQNILVKNENGTEKFKIADFGFCKLQSSSDTIIGTPMYMSPQIFKNERYGFEVDMWALGVTLFLMLNEKIHPFQINMSQKNEECYDDLISQAKNFSYRNCIQKKGGKLSQDYSPDLEDLFRRMFEIDPKKRLNFVQIRKHALFKKYFKDQINEKLVEILGKNEGMNNTILGKEKRSNMEEDENVSIKFSQCIEINLKTQFAKEKKFMHQKTQQIQFLYDNYHELDLSHGLLTHIEKMMLCYNLLKFYIILKRNFLASIRNPSKYSARLIEYFKSAQFGEQMKEYEEQLNRATDEFTSLHAVCAKNLQIIGKTNEKFSQAFHQNITEKQFSGAFKMSYRKSTNTTFNKLRKFLGTETNKGNSCNYYLALVVISHVFNRLFEEKENLPKIFKDFLDQDNTKAEDIDCGKLREWMCKASPTELNSVTRNIMRCYLG